VAFYGRSNAGKSSSLNALVNNKTFAKVSAAAGKTTEINLFNINDSFYKCECCCHESDSQCGQRDPSKGCGLYGTTLKYTGTSPSKCELDNPQNPDLAVFY
jgi:hypothetical protein